MKAVVFKCAVGLIALTFPALAGADAVGEAVRWGRFDYLNRSQIHRGGGRDTRPDNALETFLWCWGHGVAPEADVRVSVDGVVFALHDENLARVGRGISDELAKRPIEELSWQDIKDVDVGSYLSPEFASTRISSFESICAAMAHRPERLLFVDEKGATPKQIARIARRFGVERQIIFTSPRFQLMADWQREVPGGLGMVWLGVWSKDNSAASVAQADAFLEKSFQEMAASNWVGVSQVQFHVRTDFTKEDPFCPSTACMKRGIRLLHSKGITVQALSWTEGKNLELYRRLWEVGFDNLCSDDPLVLFDFLKELKRSGSLNNGDSMRELVSVRFETGENETEGRTCCLILNSAADASAFPSRSGKDNDWGMPPNPRLDGKLAAGEMCRGRRREWKPYHSNRITRDSRSPSEPLPRRTGRQVKCATGGCRN